MSAHLAQFFSLNLPAYMVVAALVCILTAAMTALLTATSKDANRLFRQAAFAAIAVVAGLGVWTSHFVAMIGYRSDIALTYDIQWTFVSALFSIVLVGIPLARTTLWPSKWAALLGFAGGLGIWAMHYCGMLAVTGCVQAQSELLNVAAALLGATNLSVAAALLARRNYLAFIVFFIMAVGAAHTVALGGTVITSAASVSSHTYARIDLVLITSISAAVLLSILSASMIAIAFLYRRDRRHSLVLATALNNMSNGLLFFGLDGRLKLFNQEYLKIFGLSDGELGLGMTRSDIVEAVGNANQWDSSRRNLAHRRAMEWMGKPSTDPIEFLTDGGTSIKLEVRDADGEGLVLTYIDVSAERNAEDRVKRMAFIDDLTDLPNRRQFADLLRTTFESGRKADLILLDIDYFKQVNDTYGHGIGDDLLVSVAKRLAGYVNENVSISRLAGDEFAVLSTGNQPESIDLAQHILNSLSHPYTLGPYVITATCSMGKCSTIDAATAGELMQFADMALYEAKRLGRSCAKEFTSELRDTFREEVEIAADIRKAMAADQFNLVYQPVIDTKTEELIGHEALIRWRHPVKGPISPAKFIPIAERHGLINQVGRWVLRRACRDAKLLPETTYIAVNVSASQFRGGTIVDDVTSALDGCGLSPSRLEIELTETALVEDSELIAQTLRSLKTLGVKVAMDDFGTGYSSLSHLKDFPLDRIKIDRSFVSSAEIDPNAAAVLRGIVQIAREMNVSTLAEGVETYEQLSIVRELGCDAVQGYLYGKPQSLDERLSVRVDRVA